METPATPGKAAGTARKRAYAVVAGNALTIAKPLSGFRGLR
jgi:hypothetical protein